MGENGTQTVGAESSGMSEENSDTFKHNDAYLVRTTIIINFFGTLEQCFSSSHSRPTISYCPLPLFHRLEVIRLFYAGQGRSTF
jgi:hypothetical protein